MTHRRPTPTIPVRPSTRPCRPSAAPDDVRGMLAGVIDPELHASIVDLGMVDDVAVDPDGDVTVKVALTTAGCPLRAQIAQRRRVEGRAACPGVADGRRSSTAR